MRVIDHEAGWFLLEEDRAVFLDAYCDYGVSGYYFMLQLNNEELSAYAREGRAYIGRLITEIEYSAPVSELSNSPFNERRLSEIYSDKVIKAINNWWTEKRLIEGSKTVPPISGNTQAKPVKKKPWYKLW